MKPLKQWGRFWTPFTSITAPGIEPWNHLHSIPQFLASHKRRTELVCIVSATFFFCIILSAPEKRLLFWVSWSSIATDVIKPDGREIRLWLGPEVSISLYQSHHNLMEEETQRFSFLRAAYYRILNGSTWAECLGGTETKTLTITHHNPSL